MNSLRPLECADATLVHGAEDTITVRDLKVLTRSSDGHRSLRSVVQSHAGD